MVVWRAVNLGAMTAVWREEMRDMLSVRLTENSWAEKLAAGMVRQMVLT